MSRIGSLVIGLILACFGLAQSQSGTYRIQEEDRLAIQVFDEGQIAANVVVTPDGNISAPFAGIVRAVGKTTSELEQELADIYKTKLKLRDPKVSVTILQTRRILCVIRGAVTRPDMYEMRPGQTISDLISRGGIDSNLGDLRRATFRRKGWTEAIPLDIYALVNNNSLVQNYEVKDGDEINVPPRRDFYVRILGEVANPRLVAFEEEMDLITALTAVGGPIANRARSSGVVVYRRKPGTKDQYLMIRCNLVAFTKKGDFSQNIKMRPGDTVYVPNNGNPNFELLNSVANAIFILDRFGLNIFPTRN